MRGGYSDIIKPFRIVAIVLTIVSVLCAILTVIFAVVAFSVAKEGLTSPENTGDYVIGFAAAYLGIEMVSLFGAAAIGFSFQGFIASILDIVKNQKAISFVFLAVNSIEIIAIFSLLGWLRGKF